VLLLQAPNAFCLQIVQLHSVPAVFMHKHGVYIVMDNKFEVDVRSLSGRLYSRVSVEGMVGANKRQPSAVYLYL
jgi:hypothetical protein